MRRSIVFRRILTIVVIFTDREKSLNLVLVSTVIRAHPKRVEMETENVSEVANQDHVKMKIDRDAIMIRDRVKIAIIVRKSIIKSKKSILAITTVILDRLVSGRNFIRMDK